MACEADAMDPHTCGRQPLAQVAHLVGSSGQAMYQERAQA